MSTLIATHGTELIEPVYKVQLTRKVQTGEYKAKQLKETQMRVTEIAQVPLDGGEQMRNGETAREKTEMWRKGRKRKEREGRIMRER